MALWFVRSFVCWVIKWRVAAMGMCVCADLYMFGWIYSYVMLLYVSHNTFAVWRTNEWHINDAANTLEAFFFCSYRSPFGVFIVTITRLKYNQIGFISLLFFFHDSLFLCSFFSFGLFLLKKWGNVSTKISWKTNTFWMYFFIFISVVFEFLWRVFKKHQG